MVALNPSIDEAEGRWISLGAACRMLGVNETTLRHWADMGKLRTFRTIGGHRRFSRQDVQALMRSAQVGEEAVPQDWNQIALRRIRRKLHGVASGHQWAERFDEAGRDRMKLLGRRLLSLSMEYLKDHHNRQDAFDEARYLGEQYGREMAGHNVPLKEAVEAFIFFRNSILDATRRSLGAATADAAMDACRDVNALSDQVLLYVAAAYSTEPSKAKR